MGSAAGSTSKKLASQMARPRAQTTEIFCSLQKWEVGFDRKNKARCVDDFLYVKQRQTQQSNRQPPCMTCVSFICARVCGCVSETVNLKRFLPAGSFFFFFFYFVAFHPSSSNLHPAKRALVEPALIFLRSSRSATACWSKVSPLCGFRLW